MLRHRVIPALLLHQGGLVKTTKFAKPKYVGDPINAIRIFNEKEVDELMVLDIDASREGREPDFALVEQLAGECFMPLAYGGGVRTVAQASRLFRLGVEKVCLQTAALENPLLVTELAAQFGSQSIVVSVDLRSAAFRGLRCFQASAGRFVPGDWRDTVRRVVSAGAGEILLNSVDRDGTLSGPDLEAIRQASELVDVPLIACGGVGSLNDMRAAVDAGASAVAVGAFFVFHGPHRAVLITYPEYRVLETLFNS